MNDSDSAERRADNSDRDVLLKVYEASLREYHFNVNLGWERTKFFLLLNSGLIAAGVGLIKVSEGSVITSIFLLLYFVFLIVLTVSGLRTISVAKNYYREAIFTKTVAERELGLLNNIPNLPEGRSNLSVAVTDGQRDFVGILSGERRASKTKESMLHKVIGLSSSITGETEAMFASMIVIEVIGAVIAVFNLASAST